MSLDIDFNKELSKEEILKKTSLKFENINGLEWLIDQYNNSVFFKGYGITLYGYGSNPLKILDELVRAFDIMFIDDSGSDKLFYEPEKYDEQDVFLNTMKQYGYVSDNKIVVPNRDESRYLPYKIERTKNQKDTDDSELPF